MAETGDVSTLNTLITTLIDSVEGYETSAGDIRDPALAQRFTARAQERRSAVSELQTVVRRLGGDPADDGSLSGGAHRVFVNLKQAVTGSDDKAVVNEVERGEDYLKGKFEAALKAEGLSGEARTAGEAGPEAGSARCARADVADPRQTPISRAPVHALMVEHTRWGQWAGKRAGPRACRGGGPAVRRCEFGGKRLAFGFAFARGPGRPPGRLGCVDSSHHALPAAVSLTLGWVIISAR